jgi:predicted TIM-barrel fold metal-dependent hydrolase
MNRLTVGADRVAVGTDYSMAMGDFDSVNKIKHLNVSEQERRQLLGENAARALNL